MVVYLVSNLGDFWGLLSGQGSKLGWGCDHFVISFPFAGAASIVPAATMFFGLLETHHGHVAFLLDPLHSC